MASVTTDEPESAVSMLLSTMMDQE